MNEAQVQSFWQAHPCGDHQVGGLDQGFARDYETFFREYDAFRYRREGHILKCLDAIDFRDKHLLEIGLGQGADSEQIIRRGGNWSGLDLTAEAVDRVRTRLKLHGLPYEELKQGSALEIPYENDSFDMVFSHGVLHHIPEIRRAQAEIARVLKPGGVFAFADSIQPADEPRLARLLEAFPAYFHEPYYAGYAKTDLAALFRSAGLDLVAEDGAFLTKAMLFQRAG